MRAILVLLSLAMFVVGYRVVFIGADTNRPAIMIAGWLFAVTAFSVAGLVAFSKPSPRRVYGAGRNGRITEFRYWT